MEGNAVITRLPGMNTLRLSALTLGASVLVACGSETATEVAEVATPMTDSTSAAAPIARTGPVAVGGPADCVERYSPAAVDGRGFAFDGTVVDVGAGVTDRPGKGQLNYLGVTFSIESWFVGGAGTTITIDMASPSPGSPLSDGASPYKPGTRLLVSGESRWGEGVLRDGIAWECGFTRYYDEVTADAWADAML